MKYSKKEFVIKLNEGADDEGIVSFGEYITGMQEAEKDVIDDCLRIGHLAIDETLRVGADFVRRIQ